MVIAVAITTAPRPQPTLQTSLQSLRDSGYRDPVVLVADGSWPDRASHTGIDVTVLTKHRGIVRTWVQAIQVLLDTTAEWLMVMQDDVTWPNDGWFRAVDALDLMASIDPRCGYASLHTMPRVESALRESGVAPVQASWYETGPVRPYLYKQRWCGAQCWALPRTSASRLLADREFRAFAAQNTRGFDHQVTLSLNRLGHRTYTWWPSLLSHDLGKGNRAPRWRVA